MSAAHTGGPWQARSTYEPWLIIGNVDGEIHADGSTSHTFTEICEVIEGDEAHANARLIAAAPELFDLVLNYRDDLRRPPADDSRDRRLQAIARVLAKATGK